MSFSKAQLFVTTMQVFFCHCESKSQQLKMVTSHVVPWKHPNPNHRCIECFPFKATQLLYLSGILSSRLLIQNRNSRTKTRFNQSRSMAKNRPPHFVFNHSSDCIHTLFVSTLLLQQGLLREQLFQSMKQTFFQLFQV